MKYFFFFFLVSITAILTAKIPASTIQSPVLEAENVKLSPNSTWFKTQLGIYIPNEHMTIDPSKYSHKLRTGAKDTLGFEYWLGDFSIKAIDSKDNCIKVDLSTEDHTRLMFIAADYFVITSYMPGQNKEELTHGSSIIYFPEKNTLKELDTIIVFGVNHNTLTCSLEHYNIGEPEYKELGKYDVIKEKFTKQIK